MSAEPLNGFDPYRAWLNVKDGHRPLTAYQLLGLEALEDDRATIRAAAGVQRMAIQAHRHEAPPVVWRQIQQELEQAIEILLDPDKKAAYDAALHVHDEVGSPAHDFSTAMAGSGQDGVVRCPGCRRSNPAARRFCAGCGTRLWEPCFQCGSLSMAGDRYCGACGANLVDGVGERARQFEASLAEAGRLRVDGRHEEAITLLTSIAKVEHSALRPHVEKARDLMKEIAAERESFQAKAEERLKQARACLAERDYESAVKQIEELPAGLRTPQMIELVEEATARLQEIASLDDELATAIACERTLHLLPKVARLLVLKPDHPRAKQLAERFQDRVRRAAEEKLSEHQYEAALKLADALPEPARSPEVRKLRERAAELVWLAADLRHAPLVDATLVHVAERLQRLDPGNPRVARLAKQLHQRAEIAANDPRRGPMPWARPPEETHFGPPIEWLTGFRRVGVEQDLAATVLAEHAGCLYVACGLALQGLGLAAVPLNLLPKGRETALGRIAGMLNEDPLAWVGRKRHRRAWGLDLSTSGLKAVKLARRDEAGGVAIESVDVVPYRKTLGEAFSDEEARTLVEEAIKTFCLRNRVKGEPISLGLPGRMALARRFTMPSLEPAKVEKAVAYEARRQVPVPLEEIAWDYHVMPGHGDEPSSKRKNQVLLVAFRRHQLLDRLAAIQGSGLHVDVVQSDCLALHNFLVYDRLSPDGPDGSRPGEPRPDESPPGEPARPDLAASLAVLDMGSDQTNLVVSSPTSVWFRSSGFGGEQFTRALVRELRLTASEAEQLKRHPARADSLSRMYAALEPAMEAAVSDARSLLKAFAAHSESPWTPPVLACGGGFQLHGLLSHFRSVS